jgi:uncharacterized membrane protein YphA (DoxX/SURF4 family)
VYIFNQVGAEPWGRIATGIAELVASILLLLPATIALGALLATCIMAGAIASHAFVLGIEVQGDGGLLFSYATIIFLTAIILLIMHRRQLPDLKAKFFPQ